MHLSNGQHIDVKPADPGAFDEETTDSDDTNSQRSNCQRAQRQGADHLGPYGQRSHSNGAKFYVSERFG